MNPNLSGKRTFTLTLGLVSLLIQTGLFAWLWLDYYSMVIMVHGLGIKFYFKGHVLFIAVYFLLLLFFTRTYGSSEVGHMKGAEAAVSQLLPLLIVNTFGYFLISLMKNWPVRIAPMVWITLAQLVAAGICFRVGRRLYARLFSPLRALLIYTDGTAGEERLSLSDGKGEFCVEGSLCISRQREEEGLASVREELGRGWQAVVLDCSEEGMRNAVLRDCYARSIPVYVAPTITDVLMKGAQPVHFMDSPVFWISGNPMSLEERVMKRGMDIVLSFLLLIPASLVMLILAVMIKCSDGGPVLYRQKRCTLDNRVFYILKFRSMRVDAEKESGARLASADDSRITPIGKYIRKFRLDELPQLFNILKGDMSFVGPRPERPEIMAEYMKDTPEFVYRTRVKAGLTGYAQVYGKYSTAYEDKLKMDLFYIENYSVWLDMKLMMVTLKIIFRPDSAEGVKP